jgi:hypothetical protein
MGEQSGCHHERERDTPSWGSRVAATMSEREEIYLMGEQVAATIGRREIHLMGEQVAATIGRKEIHLMGEQSAATIRERYTSWESR